MLQLKRVKQVTEAKGLNKISVVCEAWLQRIFRWMIRLFLHLSGLGRPGSLVAIALNL